MVQLVLISNKGNSVRYWPHSGFLGLTPVCVEGLVVTKRDTDQKLLPTRSITISVRCYEASIGRVGVLQSNILVDYTEVLWSKPDDKQYEDIGDLELPFRISIPAQIGGFSSSTFVEYRCLWRLEAVLNHSYITGIGTRQTKYSEIALTRYDLPPPLPSIPSSRHNSEPFLNLQTNKPRAPRINYSIAYPTVAIGPLDLISVPVSLQPLDSGVVIRSVSVSVERRIQFQETTVPIPATHASAIPQSEPPSFPSPTTLAVLSQDSPRHNSSTLHRFASDTHLHQAAASSTSSLSSSPTIAPYTFYPPNSTSSVATEARPLIGRAMPSTSSPPPTLQGSPKKTVSYTIAEAESSGPFQRSDSGVWSKTLTLQWPSVKSSSRWAIGETIKSQLVSVRFFLRVKIVVATHLGTDTLELQEREILVVSTNESERRIAMSKYDETTTNYRSRSKSKSPRRQHRPELETPPEVPPPKTASDALKTSPPSTQFLSSPKAKSVMRRPHTSAGPRDKIKSFTLPRANLQQNREPSVTGEGDDQRGPMFRRWKTARAESSTSDLSKKLSPRKIPGPSATSSGMAANKSTSSISDSSDDIKEWEAELAKIEVRSRRSSDMIGFPFKRKRPSIMPNIFASGRV